MIVVFLGPPYAGKGTQTALLKNKLDLPVFSMGALIREAREKGDKTFVKAYEEYALKGLNLPTEIKFSLLKEKMLDAGNNFILDNFPATQDDLNILITFLNEKKLRINKVIYISISEAEMLRRLNEITRGRPDDDPEIVRVRREIQDKDRKPVLDYFRNLGILNEVNGEGEIEEINQKIQERIND